MDSLTENPAAGEGNETHFDCVFNASIDSNDSTIQFCSFSARSSICRLNRPVSRLFVRLKENESSGSPVFTFKSNEYLKIDVTSNVHGF